MITKSSKLIAAAAVAGVMLFGVTACTSATESTPEPKPSVSESTESTTNEETVEEFAPEMMDISSLAGKEVKLKALTETDSGQGGVIILNTDQPGLWTGVSDPEGLVFFLPGGEAEGVVFNPAIQAGEKAGTGSMTLTNLETGEVVTFTIVVE